MIQPVYLSSAIMVAYVAKQFYSQDPLVEVNPEPYMLTFLLCSGANLGMHLWFTFVSRETIKRNLTRHEEGLVQRRLASKYMFLTSLFTFGSLSSFLNMKPSSRWTDDALTMVKFEN